MHLMNRDNLTYDSFLLQKKDFFFPATKSLNFIAFKHLAYLWRSIRRFLLSPYTILNSKFRPPECLGKTGAEIQKIEWSGCKDTI